MPDECSEANRRYWNGLVPIHLDSEFYDVAAFKAVESALKPTELEEMGDVSGQSLLHLMCHFGLDTLSWARMGARVTGADFSEPAIKAARRLADDCDIEAVFIESDVYNLPSRLDGQFDIVFTSYGVLFWLPDVVRWAQIVAKFLRPSGVSYIVEFHPVCGIFEQPGGATDLAVSRPYFTPDEPLRFEEGGSYAARDTRLEQRVTYSWPHPLGEVVTALIDAGLRIDFLHEFPFTVEEFFPSCVASPDGSFRLAKHDGSVPLLYSIKATKPVRRRANSLAAGSEELGCYTFASGA